MAACCLAFYDIVYCTPCGLRGCKNWPAPFPGWMSYKATKPGLALSVVYLSMFYCNEHEHLLKTEGPGGLLYR